MGKQERIEPPPGSQQSVQKDVLSLFPRCILQPAAKQCATFLSTSGARPTQGRSSWVRAIHDHRVHREVPISLILLMPSPPLAMGTHNLSQAMRLQEPDAFSSPFQRKPRHFFSISFIAQASNSSIDMKYSGRAINTCLIITRRASSNNSRGFQPARLLASRSYMGWISVLVGL